MNVGLLRLYMVYKTILIIIILIPSLSLIHKGHHRCSLDKYFFKQYYNIIVFCKVIIQCNKILYGPLYLINSPYPYTRTHVWERCGRKLLTERCNGSFDIERTKEPGSPILILRITLRKEIRRKRRGVH